MKPTIQKNFIALFLGHLHEYAHTHTLYNTQFGVHARYKMTLNILHKENDCLLNKHIITHT